ncbi:hypothetical protein APHAL10511_005014 [Amanita phalloides]|nr:hypothetical protein APHAL10511_005014 [Amanita phalloides]
MDDNKAAQEADFEDLGNGIYIKKTSTPVQQDTPDPTIILLFGWMGAKLPHLFKYTKGYDQLYPAATQILIRCEPSTYWKPEWIKRSSLCAAVEALEDLGCMAPHDTAPDSKSSSTNHRILIHTFSNGGCTQLIALGKQLSHRQLSITRVSAFIFDSCPSKDSLSMAIRAMSSIIRFAPLRLLMRLYLSVFYAYAVVRKRLFGIPLTLEKSRMQLNRPNVLPWLKKRSPRLYIYSTADNLVPWQDVKSHAEDAEKWCAEVRQVRFEKSDHVAHMRHNPERYWRAIQDAWKVACQAGD